MRYVRYALNILSVLHSSYVVILTNNRVNILAQKAFSCELDILWNGKLRT